MLRGVAGGAPTGGANNWTRTQTFTVTNESAIVISQSLTGANAQSAVDTAVTWNTSGTPTALKLNVTDTASNAASLLMDLQVASASVFRVSKAGVATTASFAATGGLSSGNTGGLTIGSRAFINCSTGDAIVRISNTAANDFNRLQFGGTTTSYPALKRNAAALETKVADDTAYAQHNQLLTGVVDGVTAPSATVGLAKIYVDTADGDLKVIFGDGVIKVLAADT